MTQPSASKETVLLVDDNAEALSAMERTLVWHGYEVLTATSPRHAREVAGAHEGPIDLLVVDVVMPEQTGIEVSRELCEVRPGLRVLFVSGYTDRELPDERLPDVPTAFLQKPMTIQELAQAARELLDR